MPSADSIEPRHLRSAIEYAVAMGHELAKRNQAVAVPRDVKAMAGKARIPTGALGRLRRTVESDDRFRTAIAAGALPELVDPVGMLWLQQPEGWQADALRLVAEIDAASDDADLRVAARREEKRRYAAEQTTVRLRADVADRDTIIDALRHEVDVLRADITKANDEVVTLRAELVDVRNESRHARDREAAATAKLQEAVKNSASDGAPHRSDDDGGLAAVAARPGPADAPQQIDPDEVADVARAVRELAARLDALAVTDTPGHTQGHAPDQRAAVRRPLAIPGGMIASSAGAAEFLLRSEAVVLIDGYNVAKLAWPSRTLEAQRTHLLDAVENLARRFGSDVTVVFDGAAVVGAHAQRRRLVRVVYSPEGVIADDVIRDEVRRLPAARAVVVVTNDAEIVADVKALGANVVPSNALIAVF